MKFDLMAGNMSWRRTAELATGLEKAGFSGMLFTEAGQVPWMMITAAALAAPRLEGVADPPEGKADPSRSPRRGPTRSTIGIFAARV